VAVGGNVAVEVEVALGWGANVGRDVAVAAGMAGLHAARKMIIEQVTNDEYFRMITSLPDPVIVPYSTFWDKKFHHTCAVNVPHFT
jgi:hypothetical protein